MIYRWKAGSRIMIDAQSAGEEMERLRVRQNGRLETGDVLEAARPPESPLHPHFDWNDTIAAERWRMEQAGHLIQCITVSIEKPDGAAVPVRAFVSVKRDHDRSYTSIAHALSDEDLRRQVLGAALRELVAWRARHTELTELAQLFGLVDKLSEELGID